ncbi:tRNA-aminoacylation cofactor arc1 isoform X1 [Punica granatum]|uniref:tRNA-aminoacylation cofactor arc1 isoform X1 n=1 Tax=Punica granatum TaxID=22663 RepID=A0A6P8BNM8_PUNGR|nr:tRNA-aminoacylation cofactor arc1 isoform X1 [Punica granatum]
MAADKTGTLSRKQLILTSLCRHLNVNYELVLRSVYPGSIEETDIKDLCLTVANMSDTSANGSAWSDNEEVAKWIAFAGGFPANSEACLGALEKLNENLATKSVLLGNGLKVSAADVVVFSAIYSSVVGLSTMDALKFPHLLRWMDHIQNKANFGDMFEKIPVEKPSFVPHVTKTIVKVEEDNPKKNVQSTKTAPKSEPETTVKKSETAKKPKADAEPNEEKKKVPEAEAAAKDELSVSLLNIRVGLIRKAWKHPSADSLLVEEIDIGEAKARQVVSGLAKYCSPDSLTNRLVVLVTNVKPGKLRDVLSEGLVLCASNEDHSVVEPLLPPEGAQIGEQISFSGIDGKPEDVLNPKKKQLEKITPNLYTDEKGVATFKGIPFMTSAGPCTSSIPKASIK